MKHTKIFRIEPAVKNYAWGSTSRIGELFNIEQAETIAELWYGTHERGPATLIQTAEHGKNSVHSLKELVAQDAEALLGSEEVKHHGCDLPYLLKIITADTPLSIQAHPTKKQAEEGFRLENEASVDIASETRNYKDRNHKPECIIALGDFYALSGFQSPENILLNLPQRSNPLLLHLRSVLSSKRETSLILKEFFTALMTAAKQEHAALLSVIREEYEKELPAHSPVQYWFRRLHSQFPGDIATLAALYLNVIELKYGEALFMQGGILHAYLSGSGVEIMANSDNVLRAGCTQKHVDIPELLSVLHFHDAAAIRPTRNEHSWYTNYSKEFKIALFEASSTHTLQLNLRDREHLSQNAAIILLLEGTMLIHNEKLKRSEAAFIPAGNEACTMQLAENSKAVVATVG